MTTEIIKLGDEDIGSNKNDVPQSSEMSLKEEEQKKEEDLTKVLHEEEMRNNGGSNDSLLLSNENSIDIISNDTTIEEQQTQEEEQEESSNSSEEESEEAEKWHDLEAGDHVIRWSSLAYMYPIQIHGIVLSANGETVTIADFGLTKYTNDDGNNNDNNSEPQQDGTNIDSDEGEDLVVGFPAGGRDPSFDSNNAASVDTIGSSSRRLNVIVLTNKKDIKTWKKVNYGGKFTSPKSKWTSWFKSRTILNKKDSDEKPLDNKDIFPVVLNVNEIEEYGGYGPLGMFITHEFVKIMLSNYILFQEELNYDNLVETKQSFEQLHSLSRNSSHGGSSSFDNEPSLPTSDMPSMPPPPPPPPSPSQHQDQQQQRVDFIHVETNYTLRQKRKSEPTVSTTPPKITKKSAFKWTRKKDKEIAPPLPQLFPIVLLFSDEEKYHFQSEFLSIVSSENGGNNHNNNLISCSSDENGCNNHNNHLKENGVYNTPPRAKHNIHNNNTIHAETTPPPPPQLPSITPLTPLSPRRNKLKHSSSQDSQQPNNNNLKTNKLPKSDPTILVLSRVNFLLQHHHTTSKVLPPYHVFYSNSECIAVWCKTGRWSTLQASVFLHTSAIGNAKQTFLGISAAAALNPLLIPAIAPLGVMYIGAPWYFLHKCKDQWEKTTKTLTERYWMHAENEVFVECIHKWSGLCVDGSSS